MKVRVQFFSHLREVTGIEEIAQEIEDGASVAALLERLYVQFPKLRAWDGSILIGAGVEFVGRNHIMIPDDPIAIMPPVQGG